MKLLTEHALSQLAAPYQHEEEMVKAGRMVRMGKLEQLGHMERMLLLKLDTTVMVGVEVGEAMVVMVIRVNREEMPIKVVMSFLS